ncbi:hypothetical protein GXW74_06210 [Roseomonas eburnea]|uniref:Uncharacterized protein n=1 Tax=Neoroseomonas eburnea TaxID=1346889 RepID=A0A9X9X8N7_9PROT|nr:hypothetical protein [Neoroseomonas eburnea]MBR0680073.1 hypothetical protein [Neoroseomonas eburnea]
MYAGLEALAQGAAAALIIGLPAVVLFWITTRRLGFGPRALRPFVTCSAAYGAIAAFGGLWAFWSLRPSLVDDAMAGVLLGGGILFAVAFLTLLLFPRPKEG